VSSANAGLKKVTEMEGFVFIVDHTRLLSFQLSCQSCQKIGIMREQFNHVGMGIVVQKGMPFVRAFNDV
jgi:hypothetical protein